MSEQDDHEAKTEEPTEKKVQEAIEKGRLPLSREPAVAIGFIGFLICVAFVLDSISPPLVQSLGLMLENAGGIRLENSADASRYAGYAVEASGRFLVWPIVIIIVSGIIASISQGVPRFVFERVTPDFSRISPGRGWQRIFGAHGLFELIKSLVKLLVIGGCLLIVFEAEKPTITNVMRSDPVIMAPVTKQALIRLTSLLSLAALGIAAFDLGWTKWKWRQEMRMTRQELKEEIKQSEGDAFVKARMRSLAQSRARKRMMAAVPSATLIIANPTHYAIALRYKREEGGAPLVIAKGKDLLALKIREIAEAHDVPVLVRRDLVRAMFDLVEVNQMIPEQFFRPVAELIHFLNTRPPRR